jgi:hypothetical protein
MASMLTQAALAKAVSSAAGRTGSVLRACLTQLKTNIIICLTASIHMQSHLSAVQPPFSSGFLKESVLASPLLVWRLKFLDLC